MFSHFLAYPGDPILSMQPLFAADPRPGKVNLGIGLYTDGRGQLPRLASVAAAQARLAQKQAPAAYLPMAGDPHYYDLVQSLLFGADHPQRLAGSIATIQSIGGSGALKVGAQVLKRNFPDAQVWISDPSWDNHRAIFASSGFIVRRYPYVDAGSQQLAFAAMADCLQALPPCAIVVLHPCCHNPTGIDLDAGQWQEIIAIVRDRHLIPFFDFAYQGFAAGIDEDCQAIRSMAAAGVSCVVAHSFSKNFALYGERCGALSFVCANRDEAERALGQMELAVRSLYSSPPRYGSQIVATILDDPLLRADWQADVAAMRQRLGAMRQALVSVLQQARPELDHRHLLNQRGLFSLTGLNAAAVDTLRERFAVYLVDSGRLCLAGLNADNVHRVAAALAAVTP